MWAPTASAGRPIQAQCANKTEGRSRKKGGLDVDSTLSVDSSCRAHQRLWQVTPGGAPCLMP